MLKQWMSLSKISNYLFQHNRSSSLWSDSVVGEESFITLFNKRIGKDWLLRHRENVNLRIVRLFSRVSFMSIRNWCQVPRIKHKRKKWSIRLMHWMIRMNSIELERSILTLVITLMMSGKTFNTILKAVKYLEPPFVSKYELQKFSKKWRSII